MAKAGKEEYLERVRTRLQADDYELSPREGFDLWAHKRRFRPTRFGFEDASVAIATLQPGAGAAELEAHAERAVAAALESKVRIVRGLGSFVVVYPVALIGRAGSALSGAARERRKHWALDEYPVLVELERGGLTSNDRRPIWGAAYFKAIREQALRYFAL